MIGGTRFGYGMYHCMGICPAVTEISRGDERHCRIGDRGVKSLFQLCEDDVGEGSMSLEPGSDLVSTSGTRDLYMGTMSPSHSSSSREGLETDGFRQKMLFGEERWGELASVGGMGTASRCLE